MTNLRAVVVLHVLSLTDPFPSRSITFENETDYVEVGRASKRENKNLTPSPRNALFDSRVMSRTHAIIRWSQEKRMIYVCDPGSMHGTWLNKIKLPLDKDVILKDGDELTFGVEVIRGTETFPPFTVRCECRWLETPLVPKQPVDKPLTEARDSRDDRQITSSVSASNTFCVPEDDEDEEDAEDAHLAKYSTTVDLTTDQTSESNASEAGSDSEDGQSVVEVPSPMTSPFKNDESSRVQPTASSTAPTQGSYQNPAQSSTVEIQNTEQPLATPRMTLPSPRYESEDASGENQYYDEYFAHSSDEESSHEAEDWDLDEEAEAEEDEEQEQEEENDVDAGLADSSVMEDPSSFAAPGSFGSSVRKPNLPTPAWNLEHGDDTMEDSARQATADISDYSPSPSQAQDLTEGKYSSLAFQPREQIYPGPRPMAPLYPLVGRHDTSSFFVNDLKVPQQFAPQVSDSNSFSPSVQKPLSPLTDFAFPPPSPYPPTAPYNDGPFAPSRLIPEPRTGNVSNSRPDYTPFMDPLSPLMPRPSCAAPASSGITWKRPLRDFKSSDTKRKAAEMESEPTENEASVAPPESHEPTNDDVDLPDAQPQTTAADLNSSASQLATVSLSESIKEPEVVERPSKRAKTTHRRSLGSHAATAIVGAVVGAVGTIAALASLPPDYFA
ncbi:hypothetical protein BDV06DRAFT_138388 [Aspergillus oleicola]